MRNTLIATVMLFAASGAAAQEFAAAQPHVLYYLSIPLGTSSRAEREPVVGFAWQGRRFDQPLRLQAPIAHFTEAGAFDAKLFLLGGVAAGVAALAAGGGGGSSSAELAATREARVQASRQTGGSTGGGSSGGGSSGGSGGTTCPPRPAC